MLHPIPGLSSKNKRKFIFIHGARNNSLECQDEAEEKLKDQKLSSNSLLLVHEKCCLVGMHKSVTWKAEEFIILSATNTWKTLISSFCYEGTVCGGEVPKESLTLPCIVPYYLVSWELLCLCSHQILQLGQSSACLKASVSLITYIFLLLCSHACFSQISLFT